MGNIAKLHKKEADTITFEDLCEKVKKQIDPFVQTGYVSIFFSFKQQFLSHNIYFFVIKVGGTEINRLP